MAEQHQPLSLPWLMLPSDDNHFSYDKDFYNIFDDEKIHNQEFQNMHILGSSNGWLIMLENNSPSIFAIDPLKISNCIHFPSLMTFPDMLEFYGDEYVYWSNFIGEVNVKSSAIKNTFIKKVFLSKDPREEDCTAVAIFGEAKRLAYCRVGDEEWTLIPQQDMVHGYVDVVFDKQGRIYAVNYEGTIRTAIVSSCSRIFWDYIYQPLVPDYSDGKYLVIDTIGQLLVINRYTGWKDYDEDVEDEAEDEKEWVPYKTTKFRVMRMDEVAGEVDEIFSLEDEGVLFLGDNQSLFLASKEKEIIKGGFKKDCIYFTDDCLLAYREPTIGGHDFGIFDMKAGCVIQTSDQCPDESEGIWPPPIWVTLPVGCT